MQAICRFEQNIAKNEVQMDPGGKENIRVVCLYSFLKDD